MKMKSLVVLVTLGSGAAYCRSVDLALPILKGGVMSVIDSENSDGPLFKFVVSVGEIAVPNKEYYEVGFTLMTTGLAHPLRATSTRIVFAHEEAISSTRPDYLDEFGGDWLYVQTFDESRLGPGLEWQYFDKTTGRSVYLANGRTEFFIGFRFAGDDGQHYGWMQFNRPDTNFLTFFELSAYDWNPLPGEPIHAGLPPAIPLTPQVTAEGLLQLAWPAAVTGWILEFSGQLGPGAEWQPVPDVGGNEIVLSPPETSRFYRLRRP